MFYDPAKGHGLPHNPFKAIVAPRPIGWISSIDGEGRANLAPYSFFNGIADDPPMVMFSTTGPKEQGTDTKDTLANIRETGAFAVSVVSEAMKDAMNLSSGLYPHGEDEFALAGLEKEMGRVVNVPFVKGAPAALECTLWREIDLPGTATLVLGLVKGIHLDDACLKDGILDVTAYRPVARLGYRDYAVVSDVFPLNRPYQD